MKNRKSRWAEREILKKAANRNGNVDAMHPQVRRAIEDGREEVTEALSNDDSSKLAGHDDARS